MAADVKALVCLAFLGAVGLLFLFLACALPAYDNWWPLLTLVFYVLSPLPVLLSRRHADSGLGSSSSALKEVCTFITTVVVVSAFALPIVLARSGSEVITTGACLLTLTANVVIFATIMGFFVVFDSEDYDYSTW